jgi:membrane protein required for colicin V production
MNALNIIILVVLIFFALKGLARGLVNEASSLAGLVLGAWLAYHFYPAVTAPIRSVTHLPVQICAFFAFIVILLACGIVAHITGNVVTAALRVVMLGGINRLGGLLIGVAEGALLLSLLFSTATAGFMPEKLKGRIKATEASAMLARTGDKILLLWRSGATKQP